MKHIGLIFILQVFIVASCVTTPNISKLPLYYTPIPQSKKKLDIPIYGSEHPFKGYPFVYWHFCKQKQSQLQLVSPESSNDSLIYRFWTTYPVGTIAQPHGLLEIKYDSNQWKGNLYYMYVNFDTRHIKEKITTYKKMEVVPLKTDWKTIIDSLYKLKIDSLPTDDKIPGYYSGNSGYQNNGPTYSFEFANQKYYKFYQYNDIYRVPEKFWQAKNVISILDLLEEEFKWDSLGSQYFK